MAQKRDFLEMELDTTNVCNSSPSTFFSLFLSLSLSLSHTQTQTPHASKQRMAQAVLCIPATSASSEHAFSSAGCVIEACQNRLNPETVDSN